ncbi:DUF2284 domain-containing protein [Alkalibaculum sporogenes]|uniref:DUF2284 domain-containing protein n=1 Tax=Alkalibaculum sporogenes TaxID=2655001 RepID=UPI0031B5D532
MINTSKLNKELTQLPINEYVFFKSKDVIFSDEVRMICEKNGCGMYGTSWACPPAVDSIQRCKEQCLHYEHAFMFTTATVVKNSYDIQGWIDARREHEKLTDDVAKIFRSYYNNCLILSTEGCSVCKVCTYPNNPCRFPNSMYPATESYGILVMQQAQVCNIKYNNGPNTVTYFSMIFF